MGRSPLARGNLSRVRGRKPCGGSIPARAGEPLASLRELEAQWVDPRSRGGTVSTGYCAPSALGRSPLARGNQVGAAQVGVAQGSIPARAGEPRLPADCALGVRVDPRSRGGTGLDERCHLSLRGRSPLARGNQAARTRSGRRHGSIPARAGEPPRVHRSLAAGGVDPRSRGGTMGWDVDELMGKGRSPLARGNLGVRHEVDRRAGSIPARAGEPLARNVLLRRRKL